VNQRTTIGISPFIASTRSNSKLKKPWGEVHLAQAPTSTWRAPVAKPEEKWWGCTTTSSRCPWVLNVEIRGCLHGENKLIISKILIFVGAITPTTYNIASAVEGATSESPVCPVAELHPVPTPVSRRSRRPSTRPLSSGTSVATMNVGSRSDRLRSARRRSSGCIRG
jgi:hypothetical protein